MSDQPKWMPSDEDLCMAFDLSDQLFEEMTEENNRKPSSEWMGPLRTLIRAAVERALAPWMQAVGLATTFAGSVEMNSDDPVSMMKEVERSLAEQERKVRRATLQEAARAVCGGWEYGHPDGEGYRYGCAAAPIRNLIAALDKEVANAAR